MNEKCEDNTHESKQDSYASDIFQNTEADMRTPSKNVISSSENLAHQHEISSDRILIIDGMAVVNSVVKLIT